MEQNRKYFDNKRLWKKFFFHTFSSVRIFAQTHQICPDLAKEIKMNRSKQFGTKNRAYHFAKIY